MPSRFYRIEIVRVAEGSSVVGLSAYISRSARMDMRGNHFNFAHRKQELLDHGLILPADAPEWAADPDQLWREAERREQTLDRKTREWRAKKNAQVAKHAMIALAIELTHAQRRQMLLDFIEQELQPLKHAVALEWAIHDDDGNPHAHLLYSTRVLGPEGFGKKARSMNPDFATRKQTGAGGKTEYKRFVSEEQEWDHRWAEFQNRWFEAHGIDMEVRDREEVPLPRLPRGQLRRPEVEEALEQVKVANKEVAEAKAHDPAEALATLTKRKAVFKAVDLRRYCSRRDISGAERTALAKGILAHPDVIELFDEQGLEAGWTTRPVRAQEQYVVESAAYGRSATGAAIAAVARNVLDQAGLTDEQRAAAAALTGEGRVALLIGRAGTGKSYLLNAVRRAYEASGWRVIGLSPTNTVATDLRTSGFKEGKTLHSALNAVENGRTKWDDTTVIIVDECAMADSRIMERLFKAAEAAGAKVILAGDDKQYESVSRGGLFSEMVRRFGAAELRQVLRQKVDWQARASESYANGDVRAALEAYDKRGQIIWCDTIEEARKKMIEGLSGALPRQGEFMYASTNEAVDALNRAKQKLLWDVRMMITCTPTPVVEFETVRGKTSLDTRGERVQFHQTDRQIGVFTAEFGTTLKVSAEQIIVRKDDGTKVDFDPRKFNQWGLGYAGTGYKGQGKTQPRTAALYDNAYAWDARAAYVIGTRHAEDTQLYVPRELAKDLDTLVGQIQRQREDRSASVRYRTKAEVKAATAAMKAARQKRRLQPQAQEPQSPTQGPQSQQFRPEEQRLGAKPVQPQQQREQSPPQASPQPRPRPSQGQKPGQPQPSQAQPTAQRRQGVRQTPWTSPGIS